MRTGYHAILAPLLICGLLAAAGGGLSRASAQEESRHFPETGFTLKGRFLQYWQQIGGLPQQGYPLSDEFVERADTDGKLYTVQYFERAVFEYHPENQAPFDTLLSLLGAFAYREKYPDGAPNQLPNSSPGARLFAETGKRVGGRFLTYWEENGGLAQQGYPLSDEFSEVSPLDGKSYLVQYFERAVFEYHPENQPPYDVLLSQLGRLRYAARQAGPGAPAEPTPTMAPARSGWSQIAPTNAGPSPRYDHSVVYDPVRGQLVVFGGRGRSTFGDTWLLDLQTRAWREVAGGPPARFGQGTVYDAANRRMIVVMGQQGDRFFNDVWAFDLDTETWQQLKENRNGADAPRTRYGQSAALDARGRVLISHGFSDQGRFDDTWAFDPRSGAWAELTPGGNKPLKRCLHELAYDSAGDRLILFGGCSSGFGSCPQGDLWALDLKNNTWTELAPASAGPSPRSNPSLVYDAQGQRILLFGGDTGNGRSAETWSYDLAGGAWSKLEFASAPGPRNSQGTAADPAGRIIIFGGNTADGPSQEVWELYY